MKDDESNLKAIQSELELLRDLIRRTITTAGEDVMRNMDGRGVGGVKSQGSAASLASKSKQDVTSSPTMGRASSARFANLK